MMIRLIIASVSFHPVLAFHNPYAIIPVRSKSARRIFENWSSANGIVLFFTTHIGDEVWTHDQCRITAEVIGGLVDLGTQDSSCGYQTVLSAYVMIPSRDRTTHIGGIAMTNTHLLLFNNL